MIPEKIILWSPASEVSHVTCQVSHTGVTCHVSHVRCHVSGVTIFFTKWWRVCYQWDLPRLVSARVPALMRHSFKTSWKCPNALDLLIKYPKRSNISTIKILFIKNSQKKSNFILNCDFWILLFRKMYFCVKTKLYLISTLNENGGGE